MMIISMENGIKKEKYMEGEFTFGPMEKDMKENGKMIRKVEKEDCFM